MKIKLGESEFDLTDLIRIQKAEVDGDGNVWLLENNQRVRKLATLNTEAVTPHTSPKQILLG